MVNPTPYKYSVDGKVLIKLRHELDFNNNSAQVIATVAAGMAHVYFGDWNKISLAQLQTNIRL